MGLEVRLTLGGGLLIFASVLSDAYIERPRRSHAIGEPFEKVSSSSLFDYKYGWSFFAAGAAFFMSELAAVLSISAYVRRFPTMEEMASNVTTCMEDSDVPQEPL
ncbi:hypothetical protein RUM44_011058 [Polyplax serrata]|uniref:Uncharacterized protein n=1 Tax=Polyplax serrata TaxID=468196 RepID=A0ABR1AP04_POLSC